MEYHRFRIDVEKIRPLLQRDLYKNPNTALREIAQNSHDAIKRRAKRDPNFSLEKDGKIVFEYDKQEGAIKACDNGVGLSKRTLLDVFRYYGRSDKDADELGVFGLGAKSIFAIADSFTIHTRSMETDETHLVYATLEGLSFQPNPPLREDYGTTITIPSKNGINAEALKEFCQCMRVPIYVKTDMGEELISQKQPWGDSSFRVQCDGFDLYLTPDAHRYTYTRNKLYVEGIFVCEFHYEQLYQVAINILQKDLVNLTISRDGAIEDDKWKLLLDRAEKAIIDYAKDRLSFEPKSLKEDEGWKILKWLHQNSNILEALPENVQANIRELAGSRVYFYKHGQWRSTDRDPLIDVLCQDKPTYYAFKRVCDIERAARGRDIIVIYRWGRNLTRETLLKWLRKFGIEEYGIGDCLPTRRALYTPHGIEYIDLSKNRFYNGERLVIFPWRIEAETLDDIARKLNCSAIKLREGETLDGVEDALNLREGSQVPEVIFRGKEFRLVGQLTIDLAESKVAPPEFTPLASFAKQLPIIFPKDLRSACILLMRGASPATFEELKSVLKAALPAEAHETLNGVHADAYRVVVPVITALDWENRYALPLFRLVMKETSRGNDAYHLVPELLQEETKQSETLLTPLAQ